MALLVRQSSQFKRDAKRLHKRGVELSRLEEVVDSLAAQESLDPKYRDHALIGNWRGHRECHIQPDWLLIYRIELEALQLVRTGSHADLFGK